MCPLELQHYFGHLSKRTAINLKILAMLQNDIPHTMSDSHLHFTLKLLNVFHKEFQSQKKIIVKYPIPKGETCSAKHKN